MPRLSALNFMLLLGSQLAASLPQPKLDSSDVNYSSSIPENPDFGDEDLASISKIPNSRAEGSDPASGFMALECPNEEDFCEYTAVSGDECLALAKNLGKGEVGVEKINQLNRALRLADQENFCDEIAEGKTFEKGTTIYLPRPEPSLVKKYRGDILFISRRFPFKAAH